MILLICVLNVHLEGNDSDVDSIQTKDHDSSAQTTEQSTADGTGVLSTPSATHTRKGTCPTCTKYYSPLRNSDTINFICCEHVK